MKFYSEKLEKFFDSEAECKDAELKAEQVEEEKKEIAEVKSNERKQYAKKVEEADKALEEQYLKYEEAKKKIIEIKKKCDEECEKILIEAKKELKQAQDNKFVALEQFNDKFGPYTISYTGDKALKEMRRHFDTNADLFHWFFPFFNW